GTDDRELVYVVFRGTADGEWLDNGLGLTSEGTPQQLEAVRYFDEVARTLDLETFDRVLATGHSKGGNKVQYITMESDNGYLIDRTYSIDGQGHSDTAISRWKNKYSAEEYEDRVSKLYGINGQNDYVSVLGNCIIPASHIRYVETPADKTDFAAYHDITRMFADFKEDSEGKSEILFKGTRNKYVLKRGELGDYAAMLSDKIMKLPIHVRDGCCASIMQAAEACKGEILGINYEHVTMPDIKEFQYAGVPVIVYSLLMKKEGRDLLKTMFTGESMVKILTEEADLEVDINGLFDEAGKIESMAQRINSLLLEIETEGLAIPFSLNGVTFNRLRIEGSVIQLKLLEMKLKKLSFILQKTAELYRDFDNRSLSFRNL
ncbi:MAG: DUF2974 domain-containing protein, partial [Parasporobacterium sp.]|nr:DUF2974 domain-containing protein [Parasporobacterium sp.]